ncbi:MAG: ATP synthase F1 subunit epsilon, partial [Mariprofundus sp.]|nr:ATP synthase F1 subunit epsilon [Mariprofundus sp.]
LVATTVEGELKILANHAPVLAILRPGILRIDCLPGCQCPEVKRDEMYVQGGFLEVQPDAVTVLADSIERSEDIDAHRAEQAVQQAREQFRASPSEHADKALIDLDVAIARLSVVKRIFWKKY